MTLASTALTMSRILQWGEYLNPTIPCLIWDSVSTMHKREIGADLFMWFCAYIACHSFPSCKTYAKGRRLCKLTVCRDLYGIILHILIYFAEYSLKFFPKSQNLNKWFVAKILMEEFYLRGRISDSIILITGNSS